ncbi:putative zinc alcohol dehydrogenase [Bimuria novae-zelandiae CBS 107.79]|uniref:Putative zinc alcohol dehydrogenase n=1 Tax=Bimuria novae-zelandiae CBS 107.79 TaxID=1447943 RepID=A0A6A5VB25_9PLEO|nr:putative zinc alcohol dehydrogenase [Bimuria novae-zelandiae CBS 107.79]
MATMRAWQYKTRNEPFESNLSLDTIPRLEAPSTCKSEKDCCILVRVHAVSINPADHKVPLIPVVGYFLNKKPATPGLDYSGVIEAIPPGTPTTLQVGDKVLGRLDWPYQRGTLAEYVLAQPNAIVKLPDSLSFAQGAALGTAAMSGLQPLEKVNIKPGASVFINGGSGGVGSYTLQIAKLLGAAHVTVTCGPANVERMKALGADEVINYREADVLDTLKADAKDKGRFYDIVIENVGAIDSLYEQCHHFMNPAGCFMQVAAPFPLFLIKRTILPGFLGGGKRRFASYLTWNDNADFQRLADWAGEGKLKTEIDSQFAFEDTKEAFERLRGGRCQGKVVVHVVKEGSI